MEHEEAVSSLAAERYVAHELSPAEQLAFEEHFFDCPKCADEVRFEMTFAANVRAVLREQRMRHRPHRAGPVGYAVCGSLRPTPALGFSFAANLVLVVGLGYSC